ncbi:MAG: helix-turn-helix transcriptional regulator [Flavobacteriaceae bacterium]|nr:helix-turn-helix transcriptional regulator [Flavobacteriaceae bacterium]
MKETEHGDYTRLRVSNTPFDMNSSIYKHYKETIPSFDGEAVYIYSFKEQRMLYASGWQNLLGYDDNELTLLTIVSITSPKFAKFSNELNDKALMFLKTKSEELEKYSFTLETEKIHKDGRHVPLFSRVGIFRSENGKVTEIIGVSQIIKSLKHGNIMEFSAYGPEKSEFEETISKELFNYYVISRKEKEALSLAAQGYAFKEIAVSLNVSQSAIEKRIIPMYKRFKVSSLPHLINFAHVNHIL